MIVDLVMIWLIFNKQAEVPRLRRGDDLKGVRLASREIKLSITITSVVVINTLQFDIRALLLVIYSTNVPLLLLN